MDSVWDVLALLPDEIGTEVCEPDWEERTEVLSTELEEAMPAELEAPLLVDAMIEDDSMATREAAMAKVKAPSTYLLLWSMEL